MRRVWAVVAACALALGTLSACTTSLPAGVDGQLTDDWPAMAAAVTPTPVVGTCYSEPSQESWTGSYTGVACTTGHWTETAYVGTFTGAVASRSVPPLAGSTDLATVFADCQTKSTAYLGGDWHAGYLWLTVTLPNSKAWKGGARWYRCEISEISHDINEEFTKSSVSLKGDLSGARTQAKTCQVVLDNGSGEITAEDGTDCAQPHNAEFAGVYTAPAGPYPSNQTARQAMVAAGCHQVVTAFLGTDPYRTRYFGFLYGGLGEEQWNLGDRSTHCFALGFSGRSPNKVRFTGSVKGIGGGKPAGWKTS